MQQQATVHFESMTPAGKHKQQMGTNVLKLRARCRHGPRHNSCVKDQHLVIVSSSYIQFHLITLFYEHYLPPPNPLNFPRSVKVQNNDLEPIKRKNKNLIQQAKETPFTNSVHKQ